MNRFLVTLALMMTSVLAYPYIKIGNLTTEHRKDPINIESKHPRLGWTITSDDKCVMQKSYHILVASSRELLDTDTGDLWDSGIVLSDKSVWVPYEGKALTPEQECHWKVKINTNRGKSEWSEPAMWAMGLMGEVNWEGRWIGWDAPFDWDREDMHSRKSARYLRHEFDTSGKKIKKAIAHISGLGLYDLYINGEKVGDYVLTPAPTDYRRTVLYNTFDVTELIAGEASKNAIAVALGNGRYSTMQQNGKPYKIPDFGYPQLRMMLTIEYEDGSKQRISTNENDWKLTANGPIRSNNEYDGEIYDANLELGDWTKSGFDDSAWIKPQRVRIPYGTLRANTSENMRVMQTLKPKSFKKIDDRYLIDFGQNTAGWVKIKINGSHKGDTIRIRYAERITPDSLTLDVENLRHAQSTDTYIANGKENGRWWSPEFSYHGFQFAEIAGIDNLGPEDIVYEVIYDDMASNGYFKSSNQVLNNLWRNARWGVVSNYKGMPLDCPQRDERQPWTGDHNMGACGENFMLDNANLYAKWAEDIREAQREDGCIPDVCPAFWNYYTPDMTWSSTFPVICDMLYEQTGNILPIINNYDAMKKWMGFIRENFTDARGLITADKYGDWCVPPEDPKLIHSNDPARKTDGTLIASAYFYKISQLMAKFARLQNLENEALAWESDADRVKEAFNTHLMTVKKGTSKATYPHILYPDSIFYGNNTVTSNVLPLAFDMVPEEYRKTVADNLIQTIIIPNNGHVSCGVIGMNWLMRELSRIGRGDVAMLLASNQTYPSWGYMIANGATAIWELWNGDTASRRMNSCNHVMMLGDVITWLYRDLAGFNPGEAGYKEIILRPDFSIPDLDSIDASYNTPYGLLESNWKKDTKTLEWEVNIPCNTSALIYLPVVDKKRIKADGGKYVGVEGNNSIWRVGSGEYRFNVKLDPAAGVERDGITDEEFLFTNAPFKECHAATIAELPNGDLVAAYFAGTRERNPDVCIYVSRKPKGSDTWTEPKIAADGVFELSDPLCAIAGLSGINEDTTPASAGPVAENFKGSIENARRKSCWNPVLFQIPGSDELLLFYKIGASVGDWTGWMTRSTDGGITWSEREALPEGFLGPIKNKPEYINGRIISPSSRENDGWRALIEYSDDNGKTWNTSGVIPSELMFTTNDTTHLQPINSIQPSILKLKDGRLQILCRTRNAKLATSFSDDNGATWSTMTLSSVPNNQSGTDAVTLKDGRHVLIYNNFETIKGTPKGPRTPLSIAISEDGSNWKHIITLEDSPINKYEYPSIIQGADGSLHAVYTWRRNRIKYVKLDLKNQIKNKHNPI